MSQSLKLQGACRSVNAGPEQLSCVASARIPTITSLVALVPGFSEADLSITLSKDVLWVAGRCSSVAPRDFRAAWRPARRRFRTEIKLLSDVAWSDTEAQP